jgi:hypothetical protein
MNRDDGPPTARLVWLGLEQQFIGNKESRALLLDAEFRTFVQGSLSISDYCHRLKSMADQLADLGEPVRDRTLVLNVIRGLNDRFSYLGALIQRQRSFPTFAEVKSDLRLAEINMAAKTAQPSQAFASSTPHPPMPPSVNSGGFGGGRKPSRRGGGKKTPGGGRGSGPGPVTAPWAGHPSWPTPWQPAFGTFQAYWAGPPGIQPRAPGSTPQAFYGGPSVLPGPPPTQPGPPPMLSGPPSTVPLPGSFLPPVASPGSPLPPAPGFVDVGPPPQGWLHPGFSWDSNMLASNFNTMTLQPPPTHEWYMDTGAETHMTSNSGNLCTFQTPSFFTPSNIVVGNGSLLPVTHTGSVTFPAACGPLHLNNVLVSPHLIKNLISVRQFTIDNKCSVEFDPSGFSVKDLETRNVIVRCNSSGPLYPLLSSVFRPLALAAGVSSSTLWHRRLGHLGHEALSSLVSSCAITCNKSDSDHLCHACQLGCHVRLPFPTSSSRATNNFDLIHCDLWTSPIPSISGYKYYLVILDDCSHFLWTFPLRLKSETFSTLTHFFAYVSTQFGVTIKSIQCDNGREFDNSSSRTFFATHGVILRMSCPHTSPQNGKAERIIRTTNNILRSLLFQASMPPSYWVEALHTATYLLNRHPTKTLASATPFLALFKTQPSYDHLRVFGCSCYPNLSSTAAHKLAPRSAACVFLGYPSDHKGYRCLDLSTNRIIISRHVIFDETSFPFSEVSSPPSSNFDFLSEFDDAPVISPGISHISGTTARRTAAPIGPSPQAAASGTTPFPASASTRVACTPSSATAPAYLVPHLPPSRPRLLRPLLPLRSLPRNTPPMLPLGTRLGALPLRRLVRLAPLVLLQSTCMGAQLCMTRYLFSSGQRLPMLWPFSLQPMTTAC